MDVSMKREGWELPAFAQTMSGGVPLFHAVASSRRRAFSSGFVTSALIERKRWVCGFFAAAYFMLKLCRKWHHLRNHAQKYISLLHQACVGPVPQ